MEPRERREPGAELFLLPVEQVLFSATLSPPQCSDPMQMDPPSSRLSLISVIAVKSKTANDQTGRPWIKVQCTLLQQRTLGEDM